MTPDADDTHTLPPELRLFLEAIGFDRDDEIDWDELDQAALQPIIRWQLVARALDLDRESAPSTGYLRQLAAFPGLVETSLAQFFDHSTGAHPTGLELAENMVRGVAERLIAYGTSTRRLADVIAESSTLLRDALLPTHPELADADPAKRTRLLQFATLAAKALGNLATLRDEYLCMRLQGAMPVTQEGYTLHVNLETRAWTWTAGEYASADFTSPATAIRSAWRRANEETKLSVSSDLRNVDPDKMMAALSTSLGKRQTEPTKVSNDLKGEVIPHDETVASGWALTSEEIGHALWLCGFHPGNNPMEVFKRAAKRAAEHQEMEERALTATARATAAEDALKLAQRLHERLGWRTGMDPEAVVMRAASCVREVDDVQAEFAKRPHLRVAGGSLAGQVHDLLELVDRAGTGEGDTLRAAADKLMYERDEALAKLAAEEERHRERMAADERRGRERTQQKQQARRYVEMCRVLGWPQHLDPPTSIAGFVDDRGHRGAFARVAVAGYLAQHSGKGLGQVLEEMVAELTIQRDSRAAKQPHRLFEQAVGILQKIRNEAGNLEDTWSATLQRVRGLATIIGTLAALQAAADSPVAADITIDMSQVDLAGVNARLIKDMRSLVNYRAGTLPAIQAIAHASEDAERRRLSAFILRIAAGTVTQDQIDAYDLAELRQVAQAMGEGPTP